MLRSREDTYEPFDQDRALPLKKCLAFLALAGVKPHVESARRWIRIGLHLGDGQYLRLKAVRLGGEYFLMPSWCEVFMRRRLLGGLVV
jgi:hypothetical protein